MHPLETLAHKQKQPVNPALDRPYDRETFKDGTPVPMVEVVRIGGEFVRLEDLTFEQALETIRNMARERELLDELSKMKDEIASAIFEKLRGGRDEVVKK